MFNNNSSITSSKLEKAFVAAYEAAAEFGDEEERPQDLVQVSRQGRRDVKVRLPWRKPLTVRIPRGRYGSAYRAVWLAVRKAYLG